MISFTGFYTNKQISKDIKLFHLLNYLKITILVHPSKYIHIVRLGAAETYRPMERTQNNHEL